MGGEYVCYIFCSVRSLVRQGNFSRAITSGNLESISEHDISAFQIGP